MGFVRLTYAAGDGAVPLGQGIGNGQAFDSTRALEHVARVTLESDHRTNRKVVPHTAAIAGLGDWAALGGAGTWHRFGEEDGEVSREEIQASRQHSKLFNSY